MTGNASTQPGKAPATPHVLIVEDDEVTALVLSEFLAAHGYRTTVAKNGPDGVARFLDERPDLALVDVLLPRKNGFQACFEMKRSDHGKRTPVVLMSAVYRDPERADEYARSLSADAFLLKPFDLDVLLRRVRVWIPSV
jgi:DNA-binding response OmpR family regulator